MINFKSTFFFFISCTFSVSHSFTSLKSALKYNANFIEGKKKSVRHQIKSNISCRCNVKCADLLKGIGLRRGKLVTKIGQHVIPRTFSVIQIFTSIKSRRGAHTGREAFHVKSTLLMLTTGGEKKAPLTWSVIYTARWSLKTSGKVGQSTHSDPVYFGKVCEGSKGSIRSQPHWSYELFQAWNSISFYVCQPEAGCGP